MEDALKARLTEIIPAPRAIVANLPYNVGTLLLIHWLHDIARQGAQALSQPYSDVPERSGDAPRRRSA